MRSRTRGASKVDYPAILAEAWAQHLAPRDIDAPTVISTFAGAGGSSLGYSMAGYRELLAVEWDDNAVETFKLNFPGVPVYHGDIAKLSVDECLRLAGIAPGELDVFDGSPPCQGFSTAGKRVMDDPRNGLFREYVRLLRGLRPKVFVMENVSGMVKGKMKIVFAEIMRELKTSGYRVSARLMNAMYFHVPQSRERMIFVGVREDLGVEPRHPGAAYGVVSVLDALPHIEKMIHDTSGLRGQGDVTRRPAPAVTVGVNSINSNHFRVHGYFTSGFNLGDIISLDAPSPALMKGGIGGSSNGQFRIMDGERGRKMTIDELKSIGSFPPGFSMIGNYEMRWARIGNSVPPLFMRAIAGHIRAHILAQVTGRTPERIGGALQ